MLENKIKFWKKRHGCLESKWLRTAHVLFPWNKTIDTSYHTLFASLYFARKSISRWRHQMETFSALLTVCAGNSPVNSPHKGQWLGALMFSFICAWINSWVNNREAGDFRRYRAHYNVTVMCLSIVFGHNKSYLVTMPSSHLNHQVC